MDQVGAIIQEKEDTLLEGEVILLGKEAIPIENISIFLQVKEKELHHKVKIIKKRNQEINHIQIKKEKIKFNKDKKLKIKNNK